jgi:predicted PurR-regulated permease PerM
MDTNKIEDQIYDYWIEILDKTSSSKSSSSSAMHSLQDWGTIVGDIIEPTIQILELFGLLVFVNRSWVKTNKKEEQSVSKLTDDDCKKYMDEIKHVFDNYNISPKKAEKMINEIIDMIKK